MSGGTDPGATDAQRAASGGVSSKQPGYPWKATAITLGVMGLMLLVAYFAIPWFSGDPLACTIVSSKIIPETGTRVIRYELRNEAWFPVNVREYMGMCNAGRMAFPFRHTPPAETLLSPGALVKGEFRMLHVLSVPDSYDTFTYVWEPTTRPLVERVADWIRDVSGKRRPQVDAYLREATKERWGRYRLPKSSMAGTTRPQGQAGAGTSSSP